ncbi:elongation factor Tu GTP binding domain-containing protein [Metarhizium guizhouense ARSEF 977]|uniref:Elongation factor Tu GTP binding domain-containing protein n=1 Tax=Metarhizium guizhouense (strain ARSEF 977) TaxID=1276136 RepID=A0A0B4H973_METGA|nr:elongation factor Tu GTP binding domain-containing protein [Metarhizium guizhouense ARSEF 977]
MASIFTYDPDPPRVSSPWLAPEDSDVLSRSPRDSTGPGLLSEYGVKKLQAEPQEGPTEYKLHLLLRPRRAFKSMSTINQPEKPSQPVCPKDIRSAKPPTLTVPASGNLPRQERLKHLTTQLLWRLQQSSPYHATSSKELSIPRLPDDNIDLSSSIRLEPLVPGLEESRGALYEIGVSDDGTLVGLTKDEMAESISTLRAMAASLGCTVDVVRMVIVGDCEWEETASSMLDGSREVNPIAKKGKLWVAEALVTPNLGLHDTSDTEYGQSGQSLSKASGTASVTPEQIAMPSRGSSTTPQLRVTLTGPTTSGKSSLLGTLSTGTLDNGRGKSRLSLLKHRHEMVSGVTSSIAQELIGYNKNSILNFSRGNIESWVDIHDCAENGRLVFLSDSGGHPRYRRTVLRGLMNWAPHWSILCIAADASEYASSGVGAVSPAGVDLVFAHLNLALKLEVPMAVVITKLDVASKQILQKTLVKILATIKDAKRIPKILQPDQIQHDDLRDIPGDDLAKVNAVVKNMAEGENLTSYVPILLTSAVKGIGIGLLHALLANLPLPPTPTSRDYVGMALNPEQPQSLFHVDDTFSLPSSYCALATDNHQLKNRGVVVSGYARFGSFSVGDKIVLGPFQPEDEESQGLGLAVDDRPAVGAHGLSISHPSSAELARIAMRNAVSASATPGEWHKAQIVSIRNLRLPVRTLEPGQAGSIGLVFELPGTSLSLPLAETPRVRRGMALAVPSTHMLDSNLSLQAASGFTASFYDPAICSLTLGSLVNVYVASVRAAARILRVSHHPFHQGSTTTGSDDIEDIFSLNTDTETGDAAAVNGMAWSGEVSLELLHSREWIELGSKVIMLEGGSQDRSGLEGFVGKIVEIVD